MWLVVKKGKEFKETLFINENQIKTITKPKLTYTSIEEKNDSKFQKNVEKYRGNDPFNLKTELYDFHEVDYRLIYTKKMTCNIELKDNTLLNGVQIMKFEKLENIFEEYDFSKVMKEEKYWFYENQLEHDKGFSKEVIEFHPDKEKIVEILKNSQKEIDRKNKELDEKESEE